VGNGWFVLDSRPCRASPAAGGTVASTTGQSFATWKTSLVQFLLSTGLVLPTFDTIVASSDDIWRQT
jgi:hypothetical protein